MRDDCIVVMYHYVADVEKTEFPALKALSISDFDSQLDWLQEHCDVITYSEFERRMNGGEPSSEKPAALLTFDDGVMHQYANAFPILKKRGLSAVFFVCDATVTETPAMLNVHRIHFLLAKLGAAAFTKAIGEALKHDWAVLQTFDRTGLYPYDIQADSDIKRMLNYELPFDLADRVLQEVFEEVLGDEAAFAKDLYFSPAQMREMAEAGMTFGTHTDMHRVIARLTPAEQHEALRRGVGRIRSVTGQTDVPFCYPYGHRSTYTDDTIQILEETGHSSAFVVLSEPVHFKNARRYELPRFDTKDLPPFPKHKNLPKDVL